MNIKNLKGAVLASSVYCDGFQIAVNATINLPEVAPETTEVTAAGGTLELPVTSKISAMEASISKQGIDRDWLNALQQKPYDLIVNIVQQSVGADGTNTPEHIKAFLRVVPKAIPAIEASYGELMEQEISLAVLSYKLVVNGSTYFHIDPVKGIFKVNGKDYNADILSMI